ncbi:MAG: hypothetical protein ABH834_01490 [Candidatus Altiarchaeota archaeon]
MTKSAFSAHRITAANGPPILKHCGLVAQDKPRRGREATRGGGDVMEKSEWIGTREAAQILGVKNTQSVNEHIRRGNIPSARKATVGDAYLMLRSEVEALKVRNQEWLRSKGRM